MNVQEFIPEEFDYNFERADGTHFRTNIALLGNVISQMQRGYSPIIAIVGKQRSGKSFFAVWFSELIFRFFHHGEDFDVTKNTFFDPEESIGMMGKAFLEPIILDEAGALFNTQEWFEKIVITMNKVIITQGYHANTYLILSPFSNDVAKSIRKHVDYICFCVSRGHIIVKKVVKKYDEINDVKIKTHYFEKIKLRKSDLDPELWAKYDDFSKKNKRTMQGDYHQLAKKKNMRIDAFGRLVHA